MNKLVFLLSLFGCCSALHAEEGVVSKVRFFPAAGHAQDMVGGQFMGSNDPNLPTMWVHGSMVSSLDSFKAFAEIKTAPPEGQWSELSTENKTPYRWIIYKGPPGSHGRVGEIEFYSKERQIRGEPFNSFTPGWRNATDGKTDVIFEGIDPDNQFAGFDLTDQVTARIPTLSPAPTESKEPLKVTLASATPGATIRYTLDGTVPRPDHGETYTGPISVDKTTTICAVSLQEGRAPSPPATGSYIIGEPGRMKTFHIGNSLTDVVFMDFSRRMRSAGYLHDATLYGLPGALTKHLWDVSAGTGTDEEKGRWAKAWADGAKATGLHDLTLQPRDWTVTEEADYANRFLKQFREKSPDVQPWLYVEWTGFDRTNPVDRGTIPTSEMKAPVPALTWEESMSGMVVYNEEVQRKLAELDKDGKHARVLPSALALGVLHHVMEEGKFPGYKGSDFLPFVLRDAIHTNNDGDFFVGCTWYAAFYGESPEGKFLPIHTNLTPEQAQILQRLAWDVIENYPDCGFYKEGTTPVGTPTISPAPGTIKDITKASLSSSTPGAWFRYTLDGTPPTRTNGYIYCGVISVRPGMTVKAIGYKSGMADSTVLEAAYPH